MRPNSSHYVNKVSCPEGALRKVFIVVVDDKRFTASCPVGAAGPSTATDLLTLSGAAADLLARRVPLSDPRHRTRKEQRSPLPGGDEEEPVGRLEKAVERRGNGSGIHRPPTARLL